jgi:iron(III) transport system ATP-binding protein
VANVSIRGLSKRFGGKVPTTAVDSLDIEIDPGEFLVLLGPSGCGKTTTLRCIAGLESADEGSIAFGDRTVFDAGRGTNVAPNKRNIGMVFQSYALWPHMTVRQNIGYPLRARRVKRATAAEWIEKAADLVDCSPLLDRYPGQLSGGQQQRVALSRGLVARPDLVLFDEPLSNLDARLRDQVRTEIHELHQRLRFTAVYVTHDQSEALALGDRLAIMRAGKVEQLGRPEEIFEEPATEYVAGFIGMENRLSLERAEGGWAHHGEPVKGEVGLDDRSRDAVTVRARPEDVQLTGPEAQVEPNALSFTATIADSEFGGRWMDVLLTVAGTRLHSRMPAGERGSWIRTLNAGEQVTAYLRPGDTTCFDQDGARIPTRHAARKPASVVGV